MVISRTMLLISSWLAGSQVVKQGTKAERRWPQILYSLSPGVRCHSYTSKKNKNNVQSVKNTVYVLSFLYCKEMKYDICDSGNTDAAFSSTSLVTSPGSITPSLQPQATVPHTFGQILWCITTVVGHQLLKPKGQVLRQKFMVFFKSVVKKVQVF